MEVPMFPGASTNVRVRGGATLVVRNDGRLRYAISKELHPRRRQAQSDFVSGHHGSSASLYCKDAGDVDLQALHRGY
jgi:hypothetical protein